MKFPINDQKKKKYYSFVPLPVFLETTIYSPCEFVSFNIFAYPSDRYVTKQIEFH